MTTIDTAELKSIRDRLTSLQYRVTQEGGTEPPFENEYWDNKEDGIYVDVVSGEPLFTSRDKYDSGTGWPSFCAPLEPDHIVSRVDTRLRAPRTEVRSRRGDSHLGHLFDDGPPSTGRRYCINSAALRFVPVARLAEEGYGKYLLMFSDGPDVGDHAEVAILAAGCFWGVEHLFRQLPGVLDAAVGYTGGSSRDPTYEEVCAGSSGHAEAVQIVFDPGVVSYEEILEFFFRMHDPTTVDQQGHDVGHQYRSAVFHISPDQRLTAERVLDRVDQSGKWPAPVVTEIEPAAPFHLAEPYHQGYLKRNPNGYSCHFLRD